MTIAITFDWMIPQRGISISLHTKQRGRGAPGPSPPPLSRVSPSSRVSHEYSACNPRHTGSTGNEGVINHENDHIKGPRHEILLSGKPPPVTSCRTIKRIQWASSRNTSPIDVYLRTGKCCVTVIVLRSFLTGNRRSTSSLLSLPLLSRTRPRRTSSSTARPGRGRLHRSGTWGPSSRAPVHLPGQSAGSSTSTAR